MDETHDKSMAFTACWSSWWRRGGKGEGREKGSKGKWDIVRKERREERGGEATGGKGIQDRAGDGGRKRDDMEGDEREEGIWWVMGGSV